MIWAVELGLQKQNCQVYPRDLLTRPLLTRYLGLEKHPKHNKTFHQSTSFAHIRIMLRSSTIVILFYIFCALCTQKVLIHCGWRKSLVDVFFKHTICHNKWRSNWYYESNQRHFQPIFSLFWFSPACDLWLQ